MISYEGRNRRTVNLLKTITFDYPEWVICSVGLMPATWRKYGKELEALVLAHPRLFPGYRGHSERPFGYSDNPLYQSGQHVDCWGTVWENLAPGLDSMDIAHPLSDWAALESLQPPDPYKDDLFGPRPDWADVKREMDEAKARGNLAAGGGLPHGFMYMRLFYLRGFENLMLDLATEDPRLWQLVEMIEAYNLPVIEKYLSLGAEYMTFGDDLGMQKALPMSPAAWRKFIKPSYGRLFRPCREAGVPIYLHTDGHILGIIPDLIEVGVTVLNPQIRANGLAGLQEVAKGKVTLNLDLDRQLFPFATSQEIQDHIHEIYEGLYLPEGGLMLFAECEPDVSLENIEVICSTLEDICHPPDLD